MDNEKNRPVLDGKMTDMVMKHIGYADGIARRYSARAGIFAQDVIQEARLALCNAVLRYREGDEASLVTFATLYINGCVAKFIMRHCLVSYLSQSQRVFVRFVSLDGCVGGEDDSCPRSEMLDADYSGDEERREKVMERVGKIMECLTDGERELIRIRFWTTDSDDNVARQCERLGISKTYLYSRCDRILVKMACYARKNGF
ncbi:MAG: hypothetical protein MJ001_02240 [Paludibacteraceae bacterium]|nr:hypothetical protein [Paludibacteraceae bacterium]